MRTNCSPFAHHGSTQIRRPKPPKQKPDPWKQSGAGPPTKYTIIRRNFRRLSNTVRETQEGPHHGLGHKDGGHVHVYQAQQRSSKIHQHGRFLLVGRTLFQKEGVKMTTKAKVKILKVKVKVKVKAKAKIQKEKVKAKI